MLVLIVEPEKVPEVREITGTLKDMQEIVDGTIEAIYPFSEEIALVCNEDGFIRGLPLNRSLKDKAGNIYNVICGTFFLCGAPADSDNFTALTEEQIKKYTKLFYIPELFIGAEGKMFLVSTGGVITQNATFIYSY